MYFYLFLFVFLLIGIQNKQWKKSLVGFENIVKANEVEDLLQQQVTQGSPPAARRSASHYHL